MTAVADRRPDAERRFRRRGHPMTGPIRAISLAVMEELLRDLCKKEGKRFYVNRLDGTDRAYRNLIRCLNDERRRSGDHNHYTIERSHAQLAVGMGYECTGNWKEDRERWHNSIRHKLNDLEALGLIEWEAVKRPNGAFRCLEIRMLDTPALRTIMDVM